MRIFNKPFVLILSLLFTVQCCFSQDVWVNDLRKVFTQNNAIIYEINLRTFGANDTNNNGIIDFDDKEESGTFLNAISRLDELAQKNINTIHVLPITPVGKTKALGTAGSLYAASSFNTLNPQLASKQTALSLEEQAEKFINEAHRRRIRVIIDLPCCGSYDLYMQRPELFLKDKNGQSVIPSDWTDVRLLNCGSENAVNKEVYNLYKEFVDMVIGLGADGIRADVATNKPASFWKDLISYSRTKDPQFLWLAEASESWTQPVVEGAVFTPYNKLLEAGFDGYYGSYFKLKDFKTGKELINLVSDTIKNTLGYGDSKSVIGSFTTHDEVSPVLINGTRLSEMIMWLNSTLPVNAYYVDGFDTADNYIYLWANKKAFKTYTDDDYYFTHRGKIDIFNYSRRPGGKDTNLSRIFTYANGIKLYYSRLISLGKFIPLRTSNPSVFAYAISYDGKSLIVAGNLNFRENADTLVYVSRLSKENMVLPIKILEPPITQNGSLNFKLQPGETQVLLTNDFEVKY